nr:uncharacterized protein LOC113722789 isoform X3 [Coffea arabica]
MFKGNSPSFLMVYRVIAFCLLLVALSFDVAVHGGELFYYYTQWTFTLVTIYFGLGSVLSLYGFCKDNRMNNKVNDRIVEDTEKGLYMPLACEGTSNGKVGGNLDYKGKSNTPCSAALWCNLFQILFQMTAGAVMLTDSVYWVVIFPFLSIEDYEMSLNFLNQHFHLFVLNELETHFQHFPWFRISYFILWTGIYVIFEWTIHACLPLWYLLAAVLHVPCYSIFALIVKLKEYALSRWYSQSYWCQR